MTDLADWPDIFKLGRAILLDLCPDDAEGSHIAPETPSDPKGTLSWLPFIRLTIIGGNDDTVTDVTTLQVDCFAGKQGDASQLAGKVRQRITASPPPQVPGVGALDFGATTSRPRSIPQGPGVFMYAATYLIHQRRP